MLTEQWMQKAQDNRMLGIKVTQGDKELYSYLWDEDCRRNLYSGTKSFTSAAVGIAIREGLIALDEKVVDAFRDDIPDTIDENWRKVTIRDLLTMCLGQKKGMLMGGQRPMIEEDDWVKLTLATPCDYAPDTHYVYNNAGPYLAGVLVQRRAGCDLVHYLMPRLFTPLGIKRPTWECDPMGYSFGAGGLFLSLDEFHRFGRLYMQGGRWEGKQLVPEEWVLASTSRQVENNTPYGYGYLFWGGDKGSFRADGKYGQISMIFRDKNAVVSFFAEARGQQVEELKKVATEGIYPLL